MIGAMLGDIIGSRHEGALFMSEPFDLVSDDCMFTDDTVLTCAVLETLLSGTTPEVALRRWWDRYPKRGYGGWFSRWANDPKAGPYGSTSNGSAMRVSPVAFLASNTDEALSMAKAISAVTHNTEEGIRGACALTLAIRVALDTGSPESVRLSVNQYAYALDRTVADYQEDQYFELACDDTVPKAIIAALEARCYEEAIRNAILIGGDCDTIGCMAGALAEALYGVPESLGQWGLSMLPDEMVGLLQDVYNQRGHEDIPFEGVEMSALLQEDSPEPSLISRMIDFLKS